MIDTSELTPAETRVWHAFPLGESVDFRAEDEDPALDITHGAERTLRARVLWALLLKASQEESEIAALKVTGVRIAGVLNLKYARETYGRAAYAYADRSNSGAHTDQAASICFTRLCRIRATPRCGRAVVPSVGCGCVATSASRAPGICGVLTDRP
ncbi:hypothetical protein ACWDO7_30615 [Streptomyces sp. NPDC003656]